MVQIELPQEQRHARRRLQQFNGLADPFLRLIDLVEEQKEARNVLIFQLAQDELQLRHLLFIGFANDYRGINRGQNTTHVLNKFDRPRAIDKCVGVAHEIRGGERRLHAHPVAACFLAGIADCGACIYRALALDRAGASEYFQKCRFTALKRAHQCNAPGTQFLAPLGPAPFCPDSLLAGRGSDLVSRPVTLSSQATRRLARAEIYRTQNNLFDEAQINDFTRGDILVEPPPEA